MSLRELEELISRGIMLLELIFVKDELFDVGGILGISATCKR